MSKTAPSTPMLCRRRKAQLLAVLSLPVTAVLTLSGGGDAVADLQNLTVAAGIPGGGDGEVYAVTKDGGAVQRITEAEFGYRIPLVNSPGSGRRCWSTKTSTVTGSPT